MHMEEDTINQFVLSGFIIKMCSVTQKGGLMNIQLVLIHQLQWTSSCSLWYSKTKYDNAATWRGTTGFYISHCICQSQVRYVSI